MLTAEASARVATGVMGCSSTRSCPRASKTRRSRSSCAEGPHPCRWLRGDHLSRRPYVPPPSPVPPCGGPGPALALLGPASARAPSSASRLERSATSTPTRRCRPRRGRGRRPGDAVGTYSSTLQSLATTVGDQPALTEKQFQDLTSTMTSLPGVANITWSVPVADDPAAVAAAQEQLRSQLGTRLTLQPRPTTIGEHRFVVSYRAVDTSGTSLGADAASVPQIVQAATSARQTGRVTVTRPYVLIADRGPAAGPAAAVGPVHRSRRGWPRAGRRGRLPRLGLRLLPHRLRPGLHGRPEQPLRTRLSLQDTTDTGQPLPLAVIDPGAALVDHSAHVDVIAGTRRWRLEVTPTVQAHAAEVGQGPVVSFAAGSAASVLLSALVFSVTAGRGRATARSSRRRPTWPPRWLAPVERGGAAHPGVPSSAPTPPSSRTVAPAAVRAVPAGRGRPGDGVVDGRGLAAAPRPRRPPSGPRPPARDDLLLYAHGQRDGPHRTRRGPLRDRHAPGRPSRRPSRPTCPRPCGRASRWARCRRSSVSPGCCTSCSAASSTTRSSTPRRPAAVVTLKAELTGSRFRGEVWRIEVATVAWGALRAPDERLRALRRGGGGRRTGSNHLSLALCRRIALRLGGDIGLEDDPRGGSVFWFTLPVRSTAGSCRPRARWHRPSGARLTPALDGT